MPQGCTFFKDVLQYNIKVLFSSFISVLYCANALVAVMMLPFNNKNKQNSNSVLKQFSVGHLSHPTQTYTEGNLR